MIISLPALSWRPFGVSNLVEHIFEPCSRYSFLVTNFVAAVFLSDTSAEPPSQAQVIGLSLVRVKIGVTLAVIGFERLDLQEPWSALPFLYNVSDNIT